MNVFAQPAADPTASPDACTHQHSTWKLVEVEIGLMGETDVQWFEHIEHFTVEAGPGRFRCTRCNKAMYYTGLWRDYYERGIECSGSDYARRHGFFPNTHPTPPQPHTESRTT